MGEPKETIFEKANTIQHQRTLRHTKIFLIVATLLSFIATLKNYQLELPVSLRILAIMTLGLSISFLLLVRGYTFAARLTAISILSISLSLITIAHGLRAGSYMFFFWMFFALPLVVPIHKYYKQELIALIACITICFAVTIVIAPHESTWQQMQSNDYDILFRGNCTLTLLLSGVFSYFIVANERHYNINLMQLLKASEDASDAKAKFLSDIGHELRTPINNMIGALSIIDADTLPPTEKEPIQILKYSSSHMLQLINNLLDFHRLELGKLQLYHQPIQLQKLLSQTVQSFTYKAAEKNLQLHVQIDHTLPETVLTDATRLTQIINNLLSNAIKYTQTGSVTLTVNVLQQQQHTVKLLFTISDTGVGISAEDIKRIFEQYWQADNDTNRKGSGSGLGLNIVQRLLQLFHSNLQVESKQHVGSKFSFTLQLPIIA
jgi:signal transduction histidine kinase